MIRKLLLASAFATATAIAAGSPAHAGGWTYTGPHGNTATVNHWGGYNGGHWGPGPCCYGAGAAAGRRRAAVGAAVGVAAASHPAYAAPPAVAYAPPPVVYAPGGYYAYVP